MRIFGGGGNDRATLQDVQADDRVFGRGRQASIQTAESLRTVSDFAEILLVGDRVDADLAALEYVFRQAGR